MGGDVRRASSDGTRCGRSAASRRYQFSYNRGFYDIPFTVLIQSKTPGARVRYTLDGSAPTLTRGLGDANPVTVRVETTTTLRAMAYKIGMRPTNVDTHTYIFIEDVLKQPYGVEGFALAPGPDDLYARSVGEGLSDRYVRRGRAWDIRTSLFEWSLLGSL